MTVEQMTAGYKRLYAQLLSDRAIAARIRSKLAHFGAPPRLEREAAGDAARMVWQLLRHGIAPGGAPRAWHFLRSLPLSRPKLLPLAVTDWVSALAMKSYAERTFLAAGRPAETAERAFGALRRALRCWRRRGAVRLRLRGAELLVRITGPLDRRLARALARAVRTVLERSQARVLLAVEAVEAAASVELERLSQALAHHGERARIVLGPGLAA